MMKLNYEFRNKQLLELALTQSGVNATQNNERLEFIGDRVLGLSVAGLLYEMYPNESEGELARRHAMLVSTETLGNVARQLGLDRQIKHGHMTAGRIVHIMANAMEAIFGAIYLDSGFDAAQNVIVDIWRELAAADVVAPKDERLTEANWSEITSDDTQLGIIWKPYFEITPKFAPSSLIF